MPTNDFEKQVQQKMEELVFVPSEAVWPAVEKQIRERKERRRLLLWWWLLPFLAGGSIYYFANHTNGTNKANTGIVAKGHDTNIKNANTTNNVHTTDTGSIQKTNTDSIINNKSVAERLYNSAPYYRRIYDNKGRAQIVRGGITAATKTTTTIAVADTENGNAEKAMAVKDNDMAAADAVLKPASVNPLGKKIFTASPVAPSFDKGALKKPTYAKKKMEWVVTANAGKTGISSGVSAIVKSAAAFDAAANYFTQNNGVTSGTGATGAPSYTATRPSDIKPGFSFGLGLSLRRYVQHTFSIEVGLQYSYYSSSVLVGRKIDSTITVRQGRKSVPGYYSNYSVLPTANNTDYGNRYHFIEIPIRVEKQLGLQSPFSLQAGITIGQLLGSNALQYDAGKNIYYKDNSLFNKTQFSISTGLDIRLWRYKPISIELGPRLQYGLGSFLDKEVYVSKHLLFAGLETRIFFKK